jgi:hypothetical protein
VTFYLVVARGFYAVLPLVGTGIRRVYNYGVRSQLLTNGMRYIVGLLDGRKIRLPRCFEDATEGLGPMMKPIFRTCFLAVCFAPIATMVQAQQMVHALSGTVKSSNAKIGMTEVQTDDGSSGHFRWMLFADPEAVNFDKTISADTVSADKFTATGHHAIVYYFGEDTVRIVVALRDLGDGPVESHIGTVVKMDRHDHLLIIKNSAGTEETFHIDPKTVADTAKGVSVGFKFDLNKDETVRVTAAQANGSATALLIATGM